MSDDHFGQRIVGVVSLSPGSRASDDEIVMDARSRLSSYKLPKELHVIDGVPRTPSGKPDYSTARQLVER